MKNTIVDRLLKGCCVMLGAALLVSMPAIAQTPPGSPQTWADQQRAQAFATQKLEKSPRRNEWVSIADGGTQLKAWVAYPQVKNKVPVVLVLHEVFGLTDSTRNTADQIAAMGYIAITPDMASGLGPNGGDIDSLPSSRAASDLMTSLSDEVTNGRLNTWLDYANKLPQSNGKFAVVGLSWGGGAAFRFATTQRKDVKAIFVFYDVGPPAVTQKGRPDTGSNAFPMQQLNVPVYGFYPTLDTRVMNSLQATKDAMSAAGKKFDPVLYEGAEHAYMRIGENPADDNPANVAAVQASLQRLQTQLKAVLK